MNLPRLFVEPLGEGELQGLKNFVGYGKTIGQVP